MLVFGVGQAVTAGGLDEPAPPPLEVALRWLVLVGLSGALGGSLALHLLAPASAVGPRTPGAASAVALARRCSVAGAVAAAAGALVLLVAQLALGGTRALPLLWSTYGLRWGLRELGLLVLLGATLAGRGSPRPAAGWAPLAAGAALACVGTALLGHSGTGGPLTPPVCSRRPRTSARRRPGRGASSSSPWRSRRSCAGTRRPGESARAVLQRFGPAATVCVAVMVVTGVYLSSEVVGSVDAAISTIYGRTLLLKVALAAVAGALALVNTVRLRRRSRRSTPRRTVLAEATAAVGVLALAAVLTSGQPAMEPQLVRAPPGPRTGWWTARWPTCRRPCRSAPTGPGPTSSWSTCSTRVDRPPRRCGRWSCR